MAQIYELIGKAMNDIGAIGKDDFNPQQKYKFRGIDAVMNALNPVMRKYGLFCTPEVLNQVREERSTTNGGTLKYSLLTVKYTVYAPDGSTVSATVIGEGMDSGDKASNKAMSVAFKYAMFQLFCIPTEEMVDPDQDTYEVAPKQPAQQPKQQAKQGKASVSTGEAVPQMQPVETAESYRKKAWAQYGADYNDPKGEKLQQFRQALVDGGLIEDKPLKEMTLDQIKAFFRLVYEQFADLREAS